ncbi:MAG: TonB-dependent receptor [Polyangiaceae bacterium]
MLEVTVEGERPPPEAKSFTRAEVRQLPGAFGDPFRAIEALPGVTPIASGVPFFYVRGAPPGNVGYFLDGVRVPYLFHIGLGPSIVHPALVQKVDLHPGGYPARFGRFAGGIVTGETTEPRNDLHGEGNLRVFDVGAMVETGFADGRGTALVGGRYSYSAAILSLVAEDVTLDYRDFQARVSYDVTPRDRVSVFSFGSYDLLGETRNGVLDILFGSEFYRVDARYDHWFGRASRMRTAVTWGWEQTRVAQQRNAKSTMLGSRVEVVHALDEKSALRGGADVTLDSYGSTELKYDDPDDPEVQKRNALFPERKDLALGGYLEATLRVAPEVELSPGLRLDLYSSVGAASIGVDPRVAARFFVTDSFRIVHAYGISHQPPSFVVPIPGLKPGTLRGGLQRAFQTSAGVEADLPEDFTGSITLFHNAFFNMTDALSVSSGEFDLFADQRALGSSVGVELLLRRRLTKRLGGFVSYTLSRSMRSVGRETFPSAFDRTHVANGVVSYDLGRKWRGGTRLVVYSGVPKTTPTSGLIVDPRPRHPDRSPAFYRVDLRVEKRWRVGERGWMAGVLEVLNATLNTETFASSTGSNEEVGPVTIPSLGLEGGF